MARTRAKRKAKHGHAAAFLKIAIVCFAVHGFIEAFNVTGRALIPFSAEIRHQAHRLVELRDLWAVELRHWEALIGEPLTENGEHSSDRVSHGP